MLDTFFADRNLYLDLPSGIGGWIGWFAFLALVVWTAWQGRKNLQLSTRFSRILFFAALIATPVTASIFRIPLGFLPSIPIPGLPAESQVPSLLPLLALPWMLAAGLISGPAAGTLGLFCGLWLGLVQTHSIFTPLEFGLLGFAFAAMIRQPYRTVFFKALGHPLVAALGLGLINIPLVILTALWGTPGSLAVRIDYSLAQSWPLILTRAVEFLIGGFFCEALLLVKWSAWHKPLHNQPSPAETSLRKRYLFRMVPLLLVMIIGLTVAGWNWAARTARSQLENRLENAASIVGNTIPYFLGTGQNLIYRQATPDLIGRTPEEIEVGLGNRLHLFHFFETLGFVEGENQAVTWYGDDEFSAGLSPEEERGVKLALKGVMVQTYALAMPEEDGKVQISFIASILQEQKPVGALIGRANLVSNPIAQTSIYLLRGLQQDGGMGAILDENRQVLYHTSEGQLGENYSAEIQETGKMFEALSPQGQSMMMIYQPAPGREWGVLVGLPTEIILENALQLALPQFFLALGVVILIIAGIMFGIRTITRGVRTAATTALAVSQGRLDIPLVIGGEDEIGQLSQAFETMRLELKTRLEELNSLLVVSQGVAANLKSQDALLPILAAAMRGSVSSVRIVVILDPYAEAGTSPRAVYGTGPKHEPYAYLDDQMVELTRYQPSLALPNVQRTRRLSIPAGYGAPAAVLAFALNYDYRFYGTMWVAFDEPNSFADDDVRFLTTLAGQAALAVSNSHLFNAAEVGRQRLEAVLNSAPEPILVFDEQMNLLLLNPASLQVPELVAVASPGKPLQQVLPNLELQKLVLRPIQEGTTTGEIALSNKRIYFVSVSLVRGERDIMGRVCILRDITYYKNLDREKSDYVSNVSHDLRSPLTLLRGYVTMIQMMGELNEQQQGFIKKMILSVDTMTSVVEKLLDLGRLESGVGLVIGRVMPILIIDEVVTGQNGDAAKKNIRIDSSKVPRHRVEIEADPALLSQALRNLLENAIKYTPMGGQVSIGLREMEDSILFEIQDTGIGIAPLDLPRVFEKFYRSSRREAYSQKGSGLGLAIVKSIVERHHGKIWVESQLGRGSVFFIQIPLKQPRSGDL